MKRDEKNQQTRRRTLDRALSEFSEKGYGGSSVNTICAVQGISKGHPLLRISNIAREKLNFPPIS